MAETQALVRGSPRFKEKVKSDSRGMHTHSHMYIRSHRHTNKGTNECIYLKDVEKAGRSGACLSSQRQVDLCEHVQPGLHNKLQASQELHSEILYPK